MTVFKILLALDDSESSRKAVGYVARLVALGLACDVTLFHVPKTPASLSKYGPSGDKCEEEALEGLLTDQAKHELEEIRREADELLFDPAEESLLDAGGSVSVHRQFGMEFQTDIAAAIIDQAQQGSYDAIVLSRRRQSTLTDMVLGSVSSRVVHDAQGTAVWLVEP